MVALVLYLTFGLVTLWGWFSTETAAQVFLGLVLAFTLWQLLATVSLRPRTLAPDEPPHFFTAEQIALFRKHPIYFRYPLSAVQYSSTFTVLSLLSAIWVAMLLFRGMWLLAALAAMSAIVCMNMAPYINPGNFLRYHRAKGALPEHLSRKLLVLESVEQKLRQG